MSRFHDLDALRAFAMLLGLVLHGLISFLPFPMWPAQDIKQHPEFVGAIVALIHGFRMQLFFLLSGFFMMMLWKKRGARGLVKNRAKRILLPLILGTLIISPVTLAIGVFGAKKKASIAASSDSHSVERKGSEELTRFLDTGTGLSGGDSVGNSLLSFAALRGNDDAVRRLIERGVDVNGRDDKNRVALHGAALMGNAEIVDHLIEAGADVNVVGSANDTPMDSASSDEKTLKWIARIAKLEFDMNEVEKGRARVKVALLEAGGKHGRELSGGQGKVAFILARLRMIAFTPIFYHLWFLNYLLWFAIAFVILAGLARAMKIPALPGIFIKAPWCLVWLIPLTWFGQRMMTNPIGPDTASGLFIWPPIFCYYGIFVLYGALAFGRREFMDSSRFAWVIHLMLAAVVGFFALMELDFGGSKDLAPPLFSALFTWLACFGLIGAFRALFSQENEKIRWVSDSAYWLYLAHLPMIMLLQIVVSDWDYPAAAKFLFIVCTTTGVLLLLYRYVIRYSIVGTILNGKKVRGAANESPSQNR